jgi:protein-tyrosine sulfotransferase
LNKWVGHIPDDVVKDMAKVAPMLRTLGYDPDANPPNYGKPDSKVADNTLHIQQNVEFWKQREEELLKRDKPPPRRAPPGGVKPPFDGMGPDGP